LLVYAGNSPESILALAVFQAGRYRRLPMQAKIGVSRNVRLLWSIGAVALVAVLLIAWLWPRGRTPVAYTSQPSATADGTPLADASEDLPAPAEPDPSPAQPARRTWTSQQPDDEPVVEFKSSGGEQMQVAEEDLPEHVRDFVGVVNRYFDAPEDQRTALLDRHIDEMMAFNKRMSAGGDDLEFVAKGDGAPGLPQERRVTIEFKDGERNITIDGEPLDHKQVKQMEQNYLEAGDPELRARINEYTRALRERMRERGMNGQISLMAFQEEETKE
jgi:hypothetical protein